MGQACNRRSYSPIQSTRGEQESCAKSCWSYCKPILQPICSWVYIFTYWPCSTDESGDKTIYTRLSNDKFNCPQTFFACFFIPIIHILLILAGVFLQLATCFSRQNPYAHWVRDSTGTIADDNATGIQYCHLECDINKGFITGLLFPDVIVVLLSFWVNLVEPALNYFEKFKASVVEKPDKLTMQKTTTIMYMCYSVVYIVLSLLLGIFYLLAFEIITRKGLVIHSIAPNVNGLFYISLIGFIAFDLLYIQVITRYAYYCDYVINHLKSKIPTQEITEEQKPEVEKAFKVLKRLNKSSTTIATEIVIVIAGFTAISCIINLFNTTDCPVYSDSSNQEDHSKINKKQNIQVVAITLRLILWALLIVFPFYKAAKVNESFFNLTKDGRPFVKYSKYFSSAARLIGLSVQPWIPKVAAFLLILAIMLGSNIKWYSSLL